MMTGATRRGLLASGAGLLAMPALVRPARAAEFSLKLGHSAPLDQPLHQRMMGAAERIKAQSGGKVELQLFPNNQLGGDNDMLSQCRSGALDFAMPTNQILSTILPVTATSALGFVWKSYDQVWPAIDGDLGAFLRAQIAAKAGLKPMNKMWDLGFRQVTSSVGPIRDAKDLVGLKIRVPIAPNLITLFKALQGSPVAVQFNELYSALQTRIADAQENPLMLVVATKIFEVQKYVSLTNHVWDAFYVVANMRMWRGLPADVQAVLADAFDDGALKMRGDVATLNVQLRGDLEKRGMVFNEVGPESFRPVLEKAGFYKEWRGKVGEEAWALLEKHSGALG